MEELHPLINFTLQQNRQNQRDAQSRGELANFSEGDYVLVARKDFFQGEKLCLRWTEPRRVTKALNHYVFQVEDLRNGSLSDIHGSRLKYYCDRSLDKDAILSHATQSEHGMPVGRLQKLVDDHNGIGVLIRWKGLPDTEDTIEPLQEVYSDVPQLLLKLLDRKNTPTHLATKARTELGL